MSEYVKGEPVLISTADLVGLNTLARSLKYSCIKFNTSHPFWTCTIKIKTLLCLGAPPQGRYLYQGRQRNTVCLDVEAEYNINESGPIHMG